MLLIKIWQGFGHAKKIPLLLKKICIYPNRLFF